MFGLLILDYRVLHLCSYHVVYLRSSIQWVNLLSAPLIFKIPFLYFFSLFFLQISSSENYGNEDRVELENTRIYNPSQYYCKRITKKIIPLIGIVIFQLGNIILDVSYIIGNAFCLDDLHSDPFLAYHIQAAAEIAFHVFNITLTTLLTVLCIIFNRKNLRLYKLTPTRFICVLIVINLIWLWLQTQLDDAVDSKLFDEKYPSEICGGCKGNKSVLEALNDACCCVCRQTPILMYFDKASVFLYSFIVEYCLLAIECVLHFMLTMVEKEVTVLETISDDGSFHSTNEELSGRCNFNHHAF